MKTFNKSRFIISFLFIVITLPLSAMVSQVVYDNPQHTSGSFTLLASDCTQQGWGYYFEVIGLPTNSLVKIDCNFNASVYADIYNDDYEYLVSTDGPNLSSGSFNTGSSGKFYVYINDEWIGGPYSFTFRFSTGTYSATEDQYLHGNSIVDGNVGIGTLNPQGKLHVSGNRPFSICSSNSYQSINGNYGIYSSANNYSGPVYGIYSYVSGGGTSNQRWAGMFSGGDVAVASGNLKVYGYGTGGKVGIGSSSTPTQALSVTGRTSIATSGTTPEEGYNGNLVITKPTASGQYINLIRSGNTRWSIGMVYNTNNFAVGQSTTTESSFTNPYLVIKSDGNVGIGTITPTTKLHLQGSPGNLMYITSTNAIDTESSGILFQGGRGIVGWDGAKTAMKICTSDNSKPIIFSNSLTNGIGELMRINGNGKVGIGTTTPDSLLTVKGGIHARSVIIDLNGVLADYVFDPSYNLMPLTEVEQFVKTNRHLPLIPSATEVQEKGMNMGEMQNKLLQKIEELTLYVIEQQKRIEQLEKNQK